jgi:hypothetical protein
MTYQTSPYIPWIFPDEAYHMNRRGIQPLKPVPIESGFDLLPGGGSEAQTLFDSHDRKVALDRVRMNKRKEQGMLGHLNTTVRSQRYDRDASRSSVPNGVFHGSPMEYLTSAGLRGGVITTKEGQEWVQQRLKQRVTEYGELASGNFAAGPPARIELSPFMNIENLLQIAFTSFTSGSFSSGLNDTLNQLLQALIKAGAAMTGNQVGRYAQAIGKMVQIARSYDKTNLAAEYDPTQGLEGVDVKQYRKLSAVQQTLRLIDAAIREIARVVDEPVAAREQVMSTLASRLFSRQLETYADDEDGEAPAPVELGQRPGVSRDILSPEQFQPSYSGEGKLRRTRRF